MKPKKTTWKTKTVQKLTTTVWNLKTKSSQRLKMNLMKHTKSLLLTAMMLTCGMVFAQPGRETDAAVQYKNNFLPAIMSGDMVKAKKSIDEAKKAIDEAAAHPETRTSPKTFLLMGDIYFGYIAAYSQDSILMEQRGEEFLNTAISGYKTSLELAKAAGPKVEKKFKAEVKETVMQKKGLFGMPMAKLFEDGKYKDAAEGYELQIRLSDVLSQKDSTSTFNAGLCYERLKEFKKAAEKYEACIQMGYSLDKTILMASMAHRNANNFEAAEKVVSEGRKNRPNDKDLLLELVNIRVQKGDKEGSEKVLNEAIASDPNNKQLHYIIGTIYSELKENEKAETALNKALEIDPNYPEALYQLGAHLITWAGDIRMAADKLKFEDPNYTKLSADADATLNRAIIPLEKYISSNPKDVDVLNILSQIYRKINNIEKSNEYKKKAEEAKQ
jgi:tetratricopeptide (TPR) repeat protein